MRPRQAIDSAVGIERDGFRGGRIAVTLSMLYVDPIDPENTLGWAGIYVAPFNEDALFSDPCAASGDAQLLLTFTAVSGTPFAGTTEINVPLLLTSGGLFGAAFNPSQVQWSNWGNATVSFPTCTTMRFQWAENGGQVGTYNYQRLLEGLDGVRCP